MAGGILDIATSGIMAFQRSLNTTSHNIVNVDTEGYSRQKVEMATRKEQFTGAGYMGQGVDISNVTRSYDQFISNQLRSSTSAFGDVNRYHELATQVDNLIADPSTGVAPAIKNFFNSVNDLADDPSSIPARQSMLSESESLTQRFNTMNQRFEQLRGQLNSDLTIMVDDINSYAESIADMNVQIAAAISRTSGPQEPNDLMDKRDVLLSKLSELVDISVLPQKNGMVTVMMGQGQPLVLDANAASLKAIPSEYDPTRLEISMTTQAGDLIITPFLRGGAISGTLRFRDEILDPTQQKLGQVVAGIALQVNALQETGFDLDGKPGEALFNFTNEDIPVLISPKNTGSAVVTAYYQDPNIVPDAVKNLDFSDFRLEYQGGVNYSLTRLSDNEVINLTAVPTVADPNVFDLNFVSSTDPDINALPGFGLQVDTNPGAINLGDRFLTRPSYNAAEKIEINIKDPRKLAAATNIEIDPDTGQPVPQLDALGNPVFDALGNPVYVTVNGPMRGDNRNALAMAELEHKMTMLGGNATFQDTYGQLVSNIGTLTRYAQTSSAAQEALLNRATEARENIAGVNLDEEAANLIKFQQAYQAAAQVISVSSSLFDTLIGAVQ